MGLQQQWMGVVKCVNLGWLVMEEEMSASFIIYAEHY